MIAWRMVLVALVGLAAAGARASGLADTIFVLDQTARSGTVFDATSGRILWNIPTTSQTHLLTADLAGSSVFFDTHVDSGSTFDGIHRFDVASAIEQERSQYETSFSHFHSRQLLASADGRYLFSRGGLVQWLDMQSGVADWHTTSISNPYSLALVPNDPTSILVSAGSSNGDPALVLLNPFTDTVRAEIIVPGVTTIPVVVNAEGTTAWAVPNHGDNGSRITAVDLEHGIIGPSVDLDRVQALALNPQGNELYAVDGTSVTVLDPHDLGTVTTITLPASASSMAMSTDGRRLFLTHPDANLVSTVDTLSRQVITQFTGLGSPSAVVALSMRPPVPYPPLPPSDEPGECILTTGQGLTMTDAVSGRIARSMLLDASETSFSVSADGQWIDATHDGGRVWRYEAATGALVQAANICPQLASPVLFTESSVVVPCSPGPATILDRATLMPRATAMLPDATTLLTVSPDGETALGTGTQCEQSCTWTPLIGMLCGTYCTVELREVSLTSGDVLRAAAYPLHEDALRIAAAPDGSWFAVVGQTGSLGRLKIWAIRSSDWASLWSVTLNQVSGVVASADSKRLIVAGTPGVVFDALSGQSLASTDFTAYSIARATDGALLYGDTGNGIAVVDSVSGQVLDVIEGRSNVIAAKMHGCHDPQALTPRPTHTITPTLPPTLSPLPTRTSTPPPSPTGTPTATPVPAVLTVVAAAAQAGSTAEVVVRLEGSEEVVGLQVDLAVEPPLRIGTCVVNPQLDKPASRFVNLPQGCSGLACSSVHALIVSVDNLERITSPTDVFRCSVLIPVGSTQGDHAIHLAGAIASNADGQRIATRTQDMALSVTGSACSGDCDHNGRVEVDELIQAVNIAQGEEGLASCAVADFDGNGVVTIDEILRGVSAAQDGCH